VKKYVVALYLAVFLAIIGIAIPVDAQNITHQGVGVVAASFTAQSAVSTTSPLAVFGKQNHSIQLVFAGGTLSACTYRLQGSNDGVTWFNISASDITCTASTQTFEISKPVLLVRGNLLTYTGTGNVTLYYVGAQ
jgi:hypothetical protein